MVSTSFMLLSRRANIISSKARLPPNQMRSFSTKLGDVNIGENKATRLFPEEVNIIYDSKCNICKLEIDFLAKRDAEKINVGAPKLRMTDLESETYNENDPANGGVSYKKGLASIHAVLPDGKVVSGVAVFALAYEQVKLGWLFKITTWPIVKNIVDVGYKVFAKYRTNLTRGASVETLVKEYEAKKALQMKLDNEDCDVCKKMD